MILVIIYTIELGLFCLYAAHKIALYRVRRRRQIRLDELNAERDRANMLPFVERRALMEGLPRDAFNTDEVSLKIITKLCTEREDDCAICLDPLFNTKIVETLCRHKFHPACIE